MSKEIVNKHWNYRLNKKCEVCNSPISDHSKGMCLSCSRSGVRNSHYKDGRCKKPTYCVDCNKKLTSHNIKRCRKCANKILGASKRGKPLSEETIEKMRKAHTGKKTGSENPMWKGGISSLGSLIRNNIKYRTWRTFVFKRDGYKCVKCGSKEKIEAHHIVQFAIIIEKNKIDTLEKALKCSALWDINNGKTLCKECHDEIEHLRRFVNYGGTPIKCYLSGYINDRKLKECIEWRMKIRDHYTQWKDGEGYPIAWLDPMNGENPDEIKNEGLESKIPGRVFVYRDYNSVKECDIIVANLDTFGEERPLIGTIYELAWAWEMKKACIIITKDNYYSKHPFILDSASMVVSSVEELLEKKYLNYFFKGWVNAR